MYVCVYIGRKWAQRQSVDSHTGNCKLFCKDKQFLRRQMMVLCLGLCIHKNSNFRDKYKAELMNTY